MKIKSAVVSLSVISLLYLFVLIWTDSNKGIFELLPAMLGMLPVLFILSAISYFFRYLRWHWLLCRTDYYVAIKFGFLAYLSGFSFTATPGKVGELVRIRYLQPQGVPPYRVISAFIFERMIDLVVVLILASFVAVEIEDFRYVAVFVVLVISTVFVIIGNPGWIRFIVAHLRLRRFSRLSRIARMVGEGVAGIKVWFNPLDIVVALTVGLFAWGIISMAFVLLLEALNISIPIEVAIAIYPLSLLVGAASMLPGGVGTTEASISAILYFFGVPIEVAIMVAVGIRVVTLWFAILCGLIAMLILEGIIHRTSVT